MTPARAARIRAERIENKRQSRKEIREQIKAKKETDVERCQSKAKAIGVTDRHLTDDELDLLRNPLL